MITRVPPPLALALALALLVASCAEPGTYPSLLPRATEKQGFEEPAAPAPAPVAADPTLDARIVAAQRTLVDGATAFERAAANTERLARAAERSPAGSDTWLDAQVSLADLDALRSADLTALTDLEQLAAERAAALAPDYPALQAAIDAGQKAVAAQTVRITAIQAMLPPS